MLALSASNMPLAIAGDVFLADLGTRDSGGGNGAGAAGR